MTTQNSPELVQDPAQDACRPLAGITYREAGDSVFVEIRDQDTEKVGLTLQARKLTDLSTNVTMVTNGFTNLDSQGRLTTGRTVSRQLRHAASTSDDAVALTLGDGTLSTFMKTLDLGKLVRYE